MQGSPLPSEKLDLFGDWDEGFDLPANVVRLYPSDRGRARVRDHEAPPVASPEAIAAAKAKLLDVVKARVELKKLKGGEWIGKCQFHTDKGRPNLSVNPKKGVYYCRRCEAKGDAITWVRHFQGLDFNAAVAYLTGDSLPPTSKAEPKKEPEFDYVGVADDADIPADGHRFAYDPTLDRVPDAVWPYRTDAGQLIGFVCRWNLPDGEKVIKPRTRWRNRKTDKLLWRWAHPPHPKPLYGLDRLAGCSSVLMVEGEKAADAAVQYFAGIACLSWMGGTPSTRHADVAPLRGRKVAIWPDNDEPGQKAAVEMAALLRGVGCEVRIIELPPDAPKKWDLADPWTFGGDPFTWARDHAVAQGMGQQERASAAGTRPDEHQAKKPNGQADQHHTAGPTPQRPKGWGKRQPGDDQPVIKLANGQAPRIVAEAQDALIETKAELYLWAGRIAMPVSATLPTANGRTTTVRRMSLTSVPAMMLAMERAARFEKYDGRSKKMVGADLPEGIAKRYLADERNWKLRPLSGVLSAPTLRYDGSILEQPGYDESTGLLLDFGDTRFPKIPQSPTRDDALAALALLRQPLASFPFVTKHEDQQQHLVKLPGLDETVAIAAGITGLVRRSLQFAPLFAYTSPSARTGKGKLVHISAMLAIGDRCPVTSQGTKQEEFEKRLEAHLIAGDIAICIDNITRPLHGDKIEQMLTEEVVNCRVLGLSLNVKAPSTMMLYASGNNLAVGGDMAGRVLLCRLDARTERPELRTFQGPDPVEMVRQRRGELAVAALTIVRAYWHAGRPKQSKPYRPGIDPPIPLVPLGSFEEWSRTVRDALVWLGCPDVVDSIDELRKTDVNLTQLAAVLEAWAATNISANGITCAGLISYAGSRPELRDALLAVAAGKDGAINPDKLGRWLARHQGQPIERRRILKGARLGSGQFWKLDVLPG